MLIAIAIAEEIQGFWIGRFCKFWASEFSLTLARRRLRNFLISVQENSEAQNFHILPILGSLLQWRWQWASIGHFVFLFVLYKLCSLLCSCVLSIILQCSLLVGWMFSLVFSFVFMWDTFFLQCSLLVHLFNLQIATAENDLPVK